MAFPSTSAPLARALAERNYNDPTPVQVAVLEPQAAARDLLVSAQTGSGKTVAYGLAVGATLLGDAETMGPAGAPLALVVAPTRELALQVHGELSWLYRNAGARVMYCVGGMDTGRERRQLMDGAHIVVGTPGRLRDHLERGNFKAGNLKAVVLDEADEMLDLGFREDLEFILETTPKDRRTLLFSATLPKGIVSLAKNYQRDALRIDASGTERAHADIEYRAVRVAQNDIGHAVVNLLRYFESPSALAFCNTRESVRHLTAILQERGFPTVSLSGELSQGERNHAILALRSGRARVCVATDVAARGLDLPSLDLVIHAELPNDAEVMQHRSGRTGRAGRKGVSVLIVPPAAGRYAQRLLSAARIDAAWSGAPTPEEIRKLDFARLLQNSLLTDAATEDDLVQARLLLAERSAEDIAAALVRIYRAQLPAPEDVIDAGESRERPDPRRRESRRDERSYAREQPDWKKDRQPARREHGASANSVWFSLNYGRQKKADPKWLVPEICRQGKVTKQDIGVIKIFDTESRFEIHEDAAERFAQAIREGGGKGGVRIEPSSAPDAPAPRRQLTLKSAPPDKPAAHAAKPRYAGKPREHRRAPG